jgi:hypothetical protein
VADESTADLIVKIAGLLDPSLASAVSQAVGQTAQFYSKAGAEAQKAAAARVQLEEQVTRQIEQLTQTREEAARSAVQREIDALQKKGVDAVKLEQYRLLLVKKIDDEVAASAAKTAAAQAAAAKAAADAEIREAERVAQAKKALEEEEHAREVATQAHLASLRDKALDSVTKIGHALEHWKEGFMEAAITLGGFQRRLEALTKDAEKGREIIENAKELAKTAPFSFEGISQGAVHLTTFGINAQKWLPLVGNLAAAMGVDFAHAAQMVGHAMSGSSEGVQQLRYSLGVTTEMLKKYGAVVGTNGEIHLAGADNLKKFQSALEKIATTERAGAMEKLAQGWKGQVSMLEDASFKFKASVGEHFIPTFAKMLSYVTEAMNALNELGPSMKFVIGWTSVLAAGTLSLTAAYVGYKAVLGPILAFMANDAALKAAMGGATMLAARAEVALGIATADTTAMLIAHDVKVKQGTASLTAQRAALMGVVGGMLAVAAVGGMVAIAGLMIATANEEEKVREETARVEHELEKAKNQAKQLGQALDQAFKQGIKGGKELADFLSKQGWTQDKAANATAGLQAELAQIEEHERLRAQGKADYTPGGGYFGIGESADEAAKHKKEYEDAIHANAKYEADRKKAIRVEMERIRAAGPGLRKEGDAPHEEGGAGSPIAGIKDELEDVKLKKEHQEIQNKDGKLTEAQTAAYRQQIAVLQQRAEQEATTAANEKERHAAMKVAIELAKELSNEDKKAAAESEKAHKTALGNRFKEWEDYYKKIEAAHRQDLDAQIRVLDQALAHHGWTDDQRRKLEEQRAGLVGKKADKEVEKAFKSDERKAEIEGDSKAYDKQIAALEELKTKYAAYGSIVERIEGKIAELQKKKITAEEHAAQKRKDIETKLQEEIDRSREGHIDAFQRATDKQVALARKAGVEEVKIAEYVAARKKEAAEDANKKAKALLDEMNDEIAKLTQGKVAYEMAKLNEKVNKVRELEKDMTPEQKAKTEATLQTWLAAKQKELLAEQAALTGRVASDMEKTADASGRHADNLERANTAAEQPVVKGFGGSLGGAVYSSMEAADAGMRAWFNTPAFGGASSAAASVQDKIQKDKDAAGTMTAADIQAKFGAMAASGKDTGPGGLPQPPFVPTVTQATATMATSTVPAATAGAGGNVAPAPAGGKTIEELQYPHGKPFDWAKDGAGGFDWQKAGAGGFDWARMPHPAMGAGVDGSGALQRGTGAQETMAGSRRVGESGNMPGSRVVQNITMHVGVNGQPLDQEEEAAAGTLAKVLAKKRANPNQGNLSTAGGP